MKNLALLTLIAALLIVPTAFAAPLPTQTSTVSVSVGPEAALSVPTNATLTSAGNFADYTGATTFNYFLRTSKTGGSANIQMQVTTDFSTGTGPSVASPVTAGDALTYTSTIASPATAVNGTAATTSAKNVATFGADARSAKAGNAGTVNWTLTNDPLYETGDYTATITWTISAT